MAGQSVLTFPEVPTAPQCRASKIQLPAIQNGSPEARKFLFYFTVHLTGSSSQMNGGSLLLYECSFLFDRSEHEQVCDQNDGIDHGHDFKDRGIDTVAVKAHTADGVGEDCRQRGKA